MPVGMPLDGPVVAQETREEVAPTQSAQEPSGARSGLPTASGDVAAHEVHETIHLLRRWSPHHTRKGDPYYPLFEAAKRKIKAAGLWKCAISNADCAGPLTLHHEYVEFADQNSVDVDQLNTLLGLHLQGDEFQKWIESPGNLEVLCTQHHLPGQRFAVHTIPSADWTLVRVHSKGIIPVEVEKQ